MKTLYSILSNYRWGIQQYDTFLGRRYHLTDLMCILVGVMLPFGEMAFPSFVIRLLEQDLRNKTVSIIFSILLYALLLKLAGVYYQCLNNWQQMNYFMARIDIATPLYRHMMHMDYEKLESKRGQAKLQAAMECIYSGNDYGIECFLRSFPIITMNLLGFLIYSFFVIRISLWIFLYMLASTVLLALLGTRSSNYQTKSLPEANARYLRRKKAMDETFEQTARNDMILYQAKDWLIDNLHHICREFLRFYEKTFGMQRTFEFTTALLTFFRDAAVYLLLIHQVAEGQLTVSQLLFFTGAIAGYSVWVQQLTQYLQQAAIQNHMMTNLRSFLDYGRLEKLPEPQSFTRQKGEPHEIRLEDVCYRYEDGADDVLSHINLTIHPGEKLALVGANGAGKSTLVKLILGLYEPTQGHIYLDGVDIRQIPRERYYEEIAAVFQESRIFSCSVAQNVSCQKNPDRVAVEDCLKKAGLSEKINALPQGIDTMLTRQLSPDGTELSGGETQKLMLARAIYQNSPVLVLDEPTAALDPIAESQMYEAYQGFCGNKTGIFISHRLSSTRFCDRVCFLKDGSITESGTHASLLAAGGDYAQMFEIQARYYKENKHLKGAAAL